jgi:hypothetical protein
MRSRHAQPAPIARSAFARYFYPPDVIVLAVRWYLRFALSYRDLEELLAERGIEVDHTTIYRWVQRFTPLLADAARPCRHAVGTRRSCHDRRWTCRPAAAAARSPGVRRVRRIPKASISRRTVRRCAPNSASTSDNTHPRTTNRPRRYPSTSPNPNSRARPASRSSDARIRVRARRSAADPTRTPSSVSAWPTSHSEIPSSPANPATLQPASHRACK